MQTKTCQCVVCRVFDAFPWSAWDPYAVRKATKVEARWLVSPYMRPLRAGESVSR